MTVAVKGGLSVQMVLPSFGPRHKGCSSCEHPYVQISTSTTSAHTLAAPRSLPCSCRHAATLLQPSDYARVSTYLEVAPKPAGELEGSTSTSTGRNDQPRVENFFSCAL